MVDVEEKEGGGIGKRERGVIGEIEREREGGRGGRE